MKLQFNKNLENHLVKNGFEIKHRLIDSAHPRIMFVLRNFEIYIYPATKSIMVWYKRPNFDIFIQGCKTLNDLYRLEQLIEGTTEKSSDL